MRRLFASAAVILAVTTAAVPSAHAQTTDQMAMRVPLDVLEVVSGGEWKHDGGAGAYRAMVLLGQVGDSIQSSVYVQWVGSKSANSPFAIVRSVAIRDVNMRKLPAASIVIDGEKVNEATIIVTSVDPKTEKPLVLAYRATRPGVVEAMHVPEAYRPKDEAKQN
jgi:hypothetical protein